VKECISEISKDILDYAAAQMKPSPYFALQLEESADVASHEQLLVYAQYIEGDSVKDSLL
jgi:hypothetical protein